MECSWASIQVQERLAAQIPLWEGGECMQLSTSLCVSLVGNLGYQQRCVPRFGPQAVVFIQFPYLFLRRCGTKKIIVFVIFVVLTSPLAEK
jgi:hypothetical protein